MAKPVVLVPSIFSATALQPLAALIDEGRRIERESASYTDISLMAGFLTRTRTTPALPCCV